MFKRMLHKKVRSAIDMITSGLLDRLSERFQTRYAKEDAEFLAAAVVNTLFCHKPSDQFLREFSEANKDVIEREISKLKQDEHICWIVSQAALAKTLITHEAEGTSPDLVENLRRLGILVPGKQPLDPREFVRMANEFYTTRPGQRQ